MLPTGSDQPDRHHPSDKEYIVTDTKPFAGRRALVTGASRGIGRSIAEQLGEAGATVALVARTTADLEVTAALVEKAGGTAVSIPADLGGADPAEAARRAIAELGGIDIVINNAGLVEPLGPSGPGIGVESWTRSMGINVTAPAMITFALLPGMLAAGWGRVVNVSSGVVARPGSMIGGNAYVTAKAALEGHTLNLAAELEGTGVTANIYRPGTVDTSMQEWIRNQDPQRVGALLPQRFTEMQASGRLITPEASARALVSRLGAPANGQILSVDDEIMDSTSR